MTTATKKKRSASASADALLQKVNSIYEFQCRQLVERREALRIVWLGLFTPGFHVLLFGPPGVAKSLLFEGLEKFAPEMNWFSTPAFKGSPPEQFLGPISLKAMTSEDERYERIVKGKFPWAEYCFIDELLRAPRAVLPVFQTGMASNLFDNGKGMERIPLISFFAATNHLVETGDDDLAAFNDRFGAKLIINPVQAQASAIQVMEGFLVRRRDNGQSVPVPHDLILTRAEIHALIERSRAIDVPFEVLEATAELRSKLLSTGIAPSIRRFNALLAAMQTDALLRGQDAVTHDQMQLGKVSLWTDQEEIGPVESAVLEFASEFEKGSAALADDFDEMRAEFLQLQANFAQTGVAGVTKEMTDSALRLVRNHELLRPRIEDHLTEAMGRDTHVLDAILEEMTLARTWISDKLMGGLLAS